MDDNFDQLEKLVDQAGGKVSAAQIRDVLVLLTEIVKDFKREIEEMKREMHPNEDWD